MVKISFEIGQINKIAKNVLKSASSKTLIFFGPMGAGKTTLIKALVKVLSGQSTGTSPTFGIVNEYQFENGEVLGYHFDFYRLNNETEALDIGFEDYVSQDVWIFIEWPEKIPSYLPLPRTEIYLENIDIDTRSVTLLNKTH